MRQQLRRGWHQAVSWFSEQPVRTEGLPVGQLCAQSHIGRRHAAPRLTLWSVWVDCGSGPGLLVWGAVMSDETFDVFISYGHADASWVHRLAGKLHQVGLDVFLDEWEIGEGDVVVHQLERGLLNSRNGVLVVSPASVQGPWVQQEYAVMVDRAVANKQRLIPVLLGDAEVPPFAAIRLWVDFRGVDGSEYERRVQRLAAALRGERPQRPPRRSQGS